MSIDVDQDFQHHEHHVWTSVILMKHQDLTLMFVKIHKIIINNKYFNKI